MRALRMLTIAVGLGTRTSHTPARWRGASGVTRACRFAAWPVRLFTRAWTQADSAGSFKLTSRRAPHTSPSLQCFEPGFHTLRAAKACALARGALACVFNEYMIATPARLDSCS